jgi:hypothetical protein
MTPKEIAKEVLELLGPNGEHWCKGQLARDVFGIAASPNNENAHSWCISGAAMKVTPVDDRGWRDFCHEVKKVSQAIGNVPAFNDGNTWPRIKGVLTLIAQGETNEH